MNFLNLNQNQMNELFFKVERAGVFSTFQDEGYYNLQHLGISSGGVMDNNLFKLSNIKTKLDSTFCVIF